MTAEQKWVAEFREVAEAIIPRGEPVTLSYTTVGHDTAIQIAPTGRVNVEHGAWGFGKIVPTGYTAATCYDLLGQWLAGEKGVEFRTVAAGGLKP